MSLDTTDENNHTTFENLQDDKEQGMNNKINLFAALLISIQTLQLNEKCKGKSISCSEYCVWENVFCGLKHCDREVKKPNND